MHEIVKNELVAETRKKWEKITPQQIAELIRIYESNSLSSDTAQAMLRAYFQGPEATVTKPEKVDISAIQTWLIDQANSNQTTILFNRSGSIPRPSAQNLQKVYEYELSILDNTATAGYRVVQGLFELVDQPAAFKKGIAIALGIDESVMSDTSHFYHNYQLANIALIDGSAKQNSILKKARISLGVLGSLSEYAEFDTSKFNTPSLTDSDYNKAKQYLFSDMIVRKIGYPSYSERLQLIQELQQEKLLSISDSRNWLQEIILDENDPLFRMYSAEFAPEITSNIIKKKRTEANYTKKEAKELTSFTFPLPDRENMLCLLVPKQLLPRLRDVATLAKSSFDEVMSDEGYKTIYTRKNTDIRIGYIQGAIPLQDTQAQYWIRRAGEREKKQHPLVYLQEAGIPSITTTEGQSLVDMNRDMANRLKLTQRVIVHERGYTVSVKNTPLAAYGYEEISFFKDSNDKSKTRVVFLVGGMPLEIKMNRNFNFDLEGRTFPNADLYNTLHYITLQAIEPIVTAPPEPAHGKHEGAKSFEKPARAATYRLLPAGWHYSPEAVLHCRKDEGIDLEALSYERQFAALLAAEEAKEKGDELKQKEYLEKSERYTTYVREIRQDDRKPIAVVLPSRQFRFLGTEHPNS